MNIYIRGGQDRYMFNVTIIRLKDLIRYLLTLIVIVIAIYVVKRYFFDKKIFELNNVNLGKKISEFINEQIIYPINVELPVVNKVSTKKINEELIDENHDNSNEEFMTQVFIGMIGTEVGVVNADFNEKRDTDENVEVAENSEEEKAEEEKEKVEENKDAEKPEVNVQTEVITKNPIKESYTTQYKSVKIKNETSYELTDEILNFDSLNIDKSNIIIFHTHTSESYTSSEKYQYTPTGNFRTTDTNYSVVRVGDELKNNLEQYGINVLHDKTFHDYPAYTGSYNRSLATVSKILENTSADIIIDLHRDAIGSYSSYAPTVKIGEDYCAQLMFVMGSNGGGLYHPNWQTNLKWAVSIQEKANEIYTGLFKPIILRNSRYNQHLSKAACIIEVGSTGNTLEQCLNSMKYLGYIINEEK